MTQVERLVIAIFATTVLIGLGVLAASSNLRFPGNEHTLRTEFPNGTQAFVTYGSYAPANYVQSVGLWVLYLALIFVVDALIFLVD